MINEITGTEGWERNQERVNEMWKFRRKAKKDNQNYKAKKSIEDQATNTVQIDDNLKNKMGRKQLEQKGSLVGT